MKTIMLHTGRGYKKSIDIAGKLIKGGGLVAFPTETVYGLGANALDSRAVKKIFKAKGRPMDNPLIVHIAKKEDVYTLARQVPKKSEILMERFWPGPLTMVFKKSKIVPDIISCGLDTVAVRMPSNRIALDLIEKSESPIAAPSANLFSKPSPTSAEHVIQDLDGKIDAVIDGGQTSIGVESTVIDMTTRIPTLLRPGGTTLEELEDALGKVRVIPINARKKLAVKSPGMKYKHYAPDAEMILVEGEPGKARMRIQEIADKQKKEGKTVGIITFSRSHNYSAHVIKFLGNEPEEIAKGLFRALREFDNEGVDLIVAEGISSKGLGLALRNRMAKAAYKIIRVK